MRLVTILNNAIKVTEDLKTGYKSISEIMYTDVLTEQDDEKVEKEIMKIANFEYNKYFSKFPNYFNNLISHKYALSRKLLEKYQYKWHWKGISENENIQWSEALIGAFKTAWDWDRLSTNKGLSWSEELIDDFKD